MKLYVMKISYTGVYQAAKNVKDPVITQARPLITYAGAFPQ